MSSPGRSLHPSLSEFIASGAGIIAVLGAFATVILLTVKGWWVPLWRDWLTSVDHKKVGIMYIVIALVMFARAVIEAALMRAQQLSAYDSPGFLSADHFGQLFSTHGTIMIFFVAMPFITGLMNYVMPLQIGARDVSFPLLNAISLMLTAGRRATDDDFTGHRPVLHRRLVGLSALHRHQVQPRRRASTTGSGRCRWARSARR